MLDRAKFLVVSEISEVSHEITAAIRGEGGSRARSLLHDEEPIDRTRESGEGDGDDPRQRTADREGIVASGFSD
jgi:hypothetical protein